MAFLRLKNSKKRVKIDARFDAVRAHAWEVHSNGYVVCRETIRIGKTSVRKSTYLHRMIMEPGREQRVRFRNGNPLDCREENLYLVGPPNEIREATISDA
jgi:hypothetical protein